MRRVLGPAMLSPVSTPDEDFCCHFATRSRSPLANHMKRRTCRLLADSIMEMLLTTREKKAGGGGAIGGGGVLLGRRIAEAAAQPNHKHKLESDHIQTSTSNPGRANGLQSESIAWLIITEILCFSLR